jgi:hypothetical protein
MKIDDLKLPSDFISHIDTSLVDPDFDPEHVPFPSTCKNIRHINDQ